MLVTDLKEDRDVSSWRDTLDVLVRERGPALFGYAYVLTGSGAQAEDLLQDALVRTFRTGRASVSLDTAHVYVKRAIASAFIDGHRRASARPQRAYGDAGDVTTTASGTAQFASAQPDHAPGVETAVDLHSAILQLAPRERACLVLHYLEDMPVAAVAETLGIAQGTVKRYLADAVSKLRVTFSDLDFEPRPTAAIVTPTVSTERR